MRSSTKLVVSLSFLAAGLTGAGAIEGCSSNESSPSSDASVDTTNFSMDASTDGVTDTSTYEATDAPADVVATDAGAAFSLTINNYASWCTVTEQGVAFSPAKSFLAGTVVSLSATAASGLYVWGYWTGTDGDAGSHDTNTSATVTMDSDKTVLACCPLSSSPDTPCP